MMHPNFFHWHARAELKPDVTILEPRWNAAAKFAEKLSVADICSLLRLVLFSGAEPEFAKRFQLEAEAGAFATPADFGSALVEAARTEPTNHVLTHHSGMTDVGLMRMLNEDNWGWARLRDRIDLPRWSE